jgi:hypothetical protein
MQTRSRKRVLPGTGNQVAVRQTLVLLLVVLCCAAKLRAADLYIGTATSDITPALPVAVTGQFHLRIARTAETPLVANVVVVESRDNNQTGDAAIFVSCDLLYIPTDLIHAVRKEVQQRLPDLDVSKIMMNATHTHTAPVLVADGEYLIPKKGVTQVNAYRAFFTKRVTEAIVKAWNNRRPGSMTWGLSHAVVGNNRRVSYANGSAGMNSKTNVPEFRSFEGYEDHDVNILFFWNQDKKFIAMSIDLACPAQEVEGRAAVNADYWHAVREKIKQQYGNEVCVLGWISAAGDHTPHLMYRQASDDRMREFRKLSRMEEIARRIVNAVEEAYEAVKEDGRTQVTMIHKVETLSLPMRVVTEAEYHDARVFIQDAEARIAADPKAADQLYRMMKWNAATVNRYEKQRTNPNPVYEMELHVLRLGDVAICTNEFELFADYGIRIQARSKALQTFVIQLVGSQAWGAYLPTEKAVKGGAYSAVVHSSLVGPEGGQVLVERSVALIKDLWPENK